MRRLLAALTMGALLVGVFAAPAVATKGQGVPFQMHVVGADRPLVMSPGFPVVGDTFGGRCGAPASWVATIDSAGNAAHLGAVTVTQDHCTTINVFVPPPLPATIADGRMKVTAANGDELWVEYSGSFLFFPTTAEDVGKSELTYAGRIVGGTGRFAGASGTLEGQAMDIFPAGPNTADFRGMIVYDPSVQAHS